VDRKKRIRSVVVLYFTVICTVAFSQSHIIDSLRNVLGTQKEDTSKVNILNALADKLEIAGKLDSALVCSNSAQTLAKKLNFKNGVAATFIHIGYVYEDEGKFDSAIKSHEKALAVYKEAGSKYGMSLCLSSIGFLNSELGNYDKAIAYDKQSLALAEEIGYKDGIARDFQNIAAIYKRQSNYPAALEYDSKSLAIYQQKNDSEGMADCMIGMANIYVNESNYAKGLEYGFKALAISQRIENKFVEGVCLTNIGTAYQEQGNNTKALEYYFKSLTVMQKLENKNSSATILGNIGGIYFEQGNMSQALVYEFQALAISKELGSKQVISLTLNTIGAFYQQQARVYKVAQQNPERRSRSVYPVSMKDSLYTKALSYYFQSLVISREIGEKKTMVLNLNNIGEVYMLQKNYRASKAYLDSALTLSISNGEKDNIASCYKDLARLDSATGNYRGAYENNKNYIVYRDSINNNESDRKIARIELGYDFKIKQDSINAVQENTNIIKADESRRKSIVTWSAIIIAILIALSAGVFINGQQIKRKRDKALFELNMMAAEQEKGFLKVEKQHVEKELQLARETLNDYIKTMVGKNELLEQFKIDIENLKNLKSKEIDERRVEDIENLNKTTILTEADWTHFKELFDNVHKGFLVRLKEKLPDLTQAEIRLVCLTKLKLDTKQMAGILGVSFATIRQTRYRLRKKLGQPEGDSIDDIVESV